MIEDSDDFDEVEVLLARYLDVAAAQGRAAADAQLSASPWLEVVRARADELERRGKFAAAALEATPTTSPLRRLGAYRLREVLGRGGMGTVHRAVHRDRRPDVAIKCLHGVAGSPTSIERFRREVAALRALQHEGIVAIVDAGDEQGMPWYAMELVDGPTFDQILRTRASIGDHVEVQSVLDRLGIDGAARARLRCSSWREFCIALVRDAARALGHAHAREIVHRDIKPGNLMLRRDGRVVVVDFGIAVGPDLRPARAGETLGSLLYAAPEQRAVGEGPATPRLDVWSLGIVLCELLTGVHPFAGESALAAQRRAARGDLRLWHARLRTLPPPLATLCLAAIDPEPARRPADGNALADELERLLDGRPIASRRLPWTVRTLRALRSRPAAALAAGMLAGAAVAVPSAAFAGANAAARRDRIASATDALLTSRPLRPGATARDGLRELYAEVERGRGQMLPEVRANVLFALGDRALELGDAGFAETCLQECVVLRQSIDADAGDLGRAVARYALSLLAHSPGRAETLLATAVSLLEATTTVGAAERLQARLDHCRALARAGRTTACDERLAALLLDLPPDRRDLIDVRIDALAFAGIQAARSARVGDGQPHLDEALRLVAERGRRDALAVRCQARWAEWLALAGRRDASAEAYDAAIAVAIDVLGGSEHPLVADLREQRARL